MNQNETVRQNDLASASLGTLMRRYCVPCVISLLVGALYNIVDQIFIANASYLGSYGNAANTVIFPLTVVALAIAVMIGDGCCAYVSIRLGSGKPAEAGLSVGNSVALALFSGVLLGALYLVFRDPLVTLFGGRINAETFRHAQTYFFWISLVAAMAAINNMIAKYSALDPVFGEEAYAQIPMAVVGIVMKFFQIIISIVVGMAAGCIPVVGFNMGAARQDRVKSLFLRLLLSESAVGLIALVIVEFFPGALIRIFGAANESAYYTEFALKSFRVYLSMVVLACVNKTAFIFLQAMGKAAASTALSMIREIVFGVGFALLLPLFFGLDGVLYSMPVSDVLTAAASAVVIIRVLRELDRAGSGKERT